jgi:two-component system, OmpR family, sensor kinase
MRWPHTLRARLTLWYTLVLGAPLVAFAGASFLVLDRALVHRADAFIDETIGAFTKELASEQHEEATATLAIESSLADVQFHEVRLAVYDSSGTLVASSPVDSTAGYAVRHPVDLVRVGADLRERSVDERVPFTVGSGEAAYRIAAEPATIFGRRYLVASAYPLHGNRETMEAVGAAYLIAIPLLLLIAAVGGNFLASRSLSPVASMSARAAEISSTNLNERLPVGNRRDELSALAAVVNGLLERLEQAFAQQRRFMADASHELRTPVAVLRTEADITLSRPNRTEAEYRDSVAVMRDSARRLGRIVDDLFLLARADAGHLPLRRGPIYLEEVVDDAARAVRALAHERGVRIDVKPLEDSPFNGDADLLGRLLLNLLDNAIKHSPTGGTVTLSLARVADEYWIGVADEGPGIPPEAQAQIFERFFRLDKTRSRDGSTDTGGAGLGLAIARWIAEAHGGRLDLVRSSDAGTEFQVTLPVPSDGNAATPPAAAVPPGRAGLVPASLTGINH